MKSRQILIMTLMCASVWHTAAAQPKKKIEAEAPRPERVLVGESVQSGAVLSEVMAIKPQMPLGPQDVLKSYEIGMSLVANKTSADFSAIVSAQQANQITREQAEFLIQQSYQLAMMQYQVLSALHDVLKHDIDQAPGQTATQSVTDSDSVVVEPFWGSASAPQ
jgi:hypothetical protein